MKRKIAGLLAGIFAVTGLAACQNQQEPVPVDETRYQVVDESTLPAYPFAPEYPAATAQNVLTTEQPTALRTVSVAADSEVRAVWISYLEMATLLKNKSESQFKSNIGAAFDNISDYGLNTVIVQVRPFGDALYNSSFFPWSYTITGTEGMDPGYDPLEVMIQQAKKRGLRIEAWINPYRVRASGNTNALSADNQAKVWMDAGSSSVIQYGGTISYNPASADARALIVNGITEIVKNYDIDGIHIDDYFYPSTDAAFDKSSYSAYQNGGGSLSLADWRRSNVETLLKEIYTAVKKADKSVLFGISPQSSVDNNYSAQYLDVEKIASTDGYCDYICPQIYFGYDNDAQPYQKTLDQWSGMVRGSSVQLYIGLAAYKVGITDSWAGSGKNEWLNNTDLLRQMVTDARDAANYGGFVLYRYDSIFNPESSVGAAVQKEKKNLRSVL